MPDPGTPYRRVRVARIGRGGARYTVDAAATQERSLAIELAEEAGTTLLGFVREGGFKLYTHPTRTAGV
jgi:FdhD protein